MDMTDVAVVRLPDETRQLEELRRRGVPRLALVAPHAPPFTPVDLLEDWVRLPAAPADIRARVLTLVGRAVQDLHRRPELSDDRLLRYGRWWVALPPTDARLIAPLVDRFGTVVGRGELAKAGWPDGLPNRNSLDVQLGRLRRRLEGSGLTLRTVRSRGCVLAPGT
ncbi:MAG TPA: transcriptional regulator [Acidimicrobiaceae bacterium]|jgi:two-component system OmpR family response regulator|nr:transcriptional regulator [Acidimicrobiaceae bacterium]